MPNFNAGAIYPQLDLQQPDLLASYLRGTMAPGAIEGQQQELQKGALGIQQLQLALRGQQAYQNVALQSLGEQGYNVGGGAPSVGVSARNGAEAQPASAAGGIQTGPQAKTYGGMDMANMEPLGGVGSTIGGMSPGTLGALAMLRGDDPLKTAQGIQEYSIKQAQLQAQGPLDLIDSIFNSASPARVTMANPSLMARWPQIAQQMGLDPVKDFNDQNVRAALALAGNTLRGQVGMPAKDYPAPLRNVNLGPQGGIAQENPVTGKKEGELIAPASYTLKDVYDPRTNTTSAVPVQTGGLGMGSGNAVNLGVKAPDDQNLKAAMFGSEMRSGLQTLNQMESGGYRLTPKGRAAAISMATDESSSPLGQLFQQEIAAHALSPEDQRYISAMMPLLQAAGHDQSGARLTTAQIRQNVESLLPLGKDEGNLAQVNKNRQGFYVGLLGQAGSAAQLPQYKSTLGADLARAQSPKTVTAAQVADYAKQHNLSVAAATAHVKANGFTVQ